MRLPRVKKHWVPLHDGHVPDLPQTRGRTYSSRTARPLALLHAPMPSEMTTPSERRSRLAFPQISGVDGAKDDIGQTQPACMRRPVSSLEGAQPSALIQRAAIQLQQPLRGLARWEVSLARPLGSCLAASPMPPQTAIPFPD